MITFFNKIIRSFRSGASSRLHSGFLSAEQLRGNFFKRLAPRRGQVAVVMILIIAIGLIFYAVVLNLSRMSQVKTVTLIAAESTASSMASFMASYGQKIFEEQLGGRRKVCAWTALFTALIMVIVIIIIIIIIIVSWGSAAPAAAGLLGVTVGTLAVIVGVMVGLALAFAIASLALQAAVVEPGITAMWNRMSSDSLSITDQFVERGIQTALSGIVTDQVKIPDLTDTDTDTFYGYIDPNDPYLGAKDKVTRFGSFYTKRLKNIPLSNEEIAVDEFVRALKEFVFEQPLGDNGWALYDEVDCSRAGASVCCPSVARRQATPATPIRNYPAQCDPCCQPDYISNPTCATPGPDLPECCSPLGDHDNPVCDPSNPDKPECCIPLLGNDCRTIKDCRTISNRPECCYLPAGNADKCGDAANCDVTSPYGAAYPFIYDPYADDPTTTTPRKFTSFREAIGKDDEHHLYRVNSANTGTFVGAETPVWHEFLGTSLGIPPPVGAAPVPPGVLVPAPHLPRQPGFNLSDTGGFYSSDARTGIFSFFYKIADQGMDLRDLNYLDDPAVTYERQCHWCDAGFDDVLCPNPATPNWMPNEVPPHLDLSLAPPTATGLSGNGCVDNANTVVPLPDGGPNQKPQLLDKVNGTNTIDTILTGNNQCASFVGGWKRGGDRFCSSVYPYFMNCPKHGGSPPPCTETYDPDGAGPEPVVTIQVECRCDTAAVGARAPSNWPDDKLDDLLYASGDFIAFAKRIVDTPVNILKATFEDWYPDAAYWIEPLCTSATCPGSFTKKIRDKDNTGPADLRCTGCPDGLPCDPICGGRTIHGDGISGNDPGEEDWSVLHQVRRDIQGFNRAITNWISLPPDPAGLVEVPQYVSDSCLLSTAEESTWCVPPAQPGIPNEHGEDECGCVTSGEAATFDINGNGVRGDLEDVVACLDWNSKDLVAGGVTVDIDPNPLVNNFVPVVGNYLKFLKCDQDCNRVNCENLPRSLVPGFCQLGFNDGLSAADQAIIDECLARTNLALTPLAECAQDCQLAANLLDGGGNPVITQPYLPPDMANWNAVQTCINECTTGAFSGGPSCSAACGPNPLMFPSMTCTSPVNTRSDFENARCGFLGSCCDLPPVVSGQNDFYDALQTATGGICGADWPATYANNWGLNVPLAAELYRAMGSCWSDGLTYPENIFYKAVKEAKDNLTVPCQAPPFDVDGVSCDDTHINQFVQCLNDIFDGGGCDPGGPCFNLPVASSAGMQYKIPPLEPGIVSPLGGPGCDDTATIQAMRACLNPATCNQTNCWSINDGGLMPDINCAANPLLLDPTWQIKDPRVDEPATQTALKNCLGLPGGLPGGCQANVLDCQYVDGYLGINLFVPPAPPLVLGPPTRSAEFNAQCSSSATCVANGCDNTAYTLNGLNRNFVCGALTAYRSVMQICAASLENSCAWAGGWGQGLDLDDQPPIVPGSWHDAVVAATLAAGGSCNDLSLGGFRDLLTKSIAEAKVQVEKMGKRSDFLKDLLQDALNISYLSPTLGIDNLYTAYGQPFLPAPPDQYPSADDFDLSDPRFTGFAGVPLVIEPVSGGIFNSNDPLFAGFLGATVPWAPAPASDGVLAEGNTHFTRFLDNGTPFDAWQDTTFCWGPDLANDCGRPDLPCDNAKWPCQDPTQLYNVKTNRRVQDSPAERLIDARIQKDESPKLPAVAVYGWKDYPKGSRPGLWHAVKVEVRTPRRCNNSCGLNGTGDPQWPRVKTYTKAWGLRRCYEMDSTEGMVKARVLRWDEDRQDWNLLKFPDGSSIWKIRLFHPGSGPAPTDVPIGLLAGHDDPTGEFCIQESDMELRDLRSNYNETSCRDSGVNCGNAFPWGYAFMLNRTPDFGAPGGSPEGRYANCWKNVHRVLEHGVVSESCAMYYFGNGMQVKFTQCDDDFTRGLN